MEAAVDSKSQVNDTPEVLEVGHESYALVYQAASRTFQVAEIIGDELEICRADRIEFSDWRSLASFCVGVSKLFGMPILSPAVDQLLPEDLRDFKTWLISGSYAALPKAFREQVVDTREFLCDKYMPFEWDKDSGVEHGRIVLANLDIHANDNSCAIVSADHSSIALDAYQVVALVTYVLSDLRTQEVTPDWYAPFLNSDQVKDLFACVSELRRETDAMSLSAATAPSVFAQGWIPHDQWLLEARERLKLEVSMALSTQESDS